VSHCALHQPEPQHSVLHNALLCRASVGQLDLRFAGPRICDPQLLRPLRRRGDADLRRHRCGPECKHALSSCRITQHRGGSCRRPKLIADLNPLHSRHAQVCATTPLSYLPQTTALTMKAATTCIFSSRRVHCELHGAPWFWWAPDVTRRACVPLLGASACDLILQRAVQHLLPPPGLIFASRLMQTRVQALAL